MAKPIYLDDRTIEKLLSEVKDKLVKARSVEGKVNISAAVDTKPAKKVKLEFTDTTYMKMIYLLDHFDGEVGWYGLSERTREGFVVYDILVYPQDVTSATVQTDEIELGKWDDNLSDEEFIHKRFHGHSHVNFAPSPSGTDIADREQKVKMLSKDDYFIFLIINKDREYSAAIYDMAANTQYETEDIELGLSLQVVQFMESLDNVKEKPVYSGASFSKQNFYSYKGGKWADVDSFLD